jgi:hypothetical protein
MFLKGVQQQQNQEPYIDTSIIAFKLNDTHHKTLSTRLIPSLSRILRIGSQISLVYRERMPGVLKMPSRISCVAIPQGIPAVVAIAEWPIGFPYISRVEVRVS